MAITSRDQMIDTATISKGCDIIDQAADDYAKCGKLIRTAASVCTQDAFSVEKKSMQPTMEELAASVEKIQTEIRDLTAQIRSAAVKVHTQQENDYNAYVQQQSANQENANNI